MLYIFILSRSGIVLEVTTSLLSITELESCRRNHPSSVVLKGKSIKFAFVAVTAFAVATSDYSALKAPNWLLWIAVGTLLVLWFSLVYPVHRLRDLPIQIHGLPRIRYSTFSSIATMFGTPLPCLRQ